MPKSHLPYPPEFRRQLVERVRAGRTPEKLAREFEPSAQAIRTWVRQAERDEGHRSDGLTSAEREEAADITYISTWAGFLYLAVIIDAFSRRVVGWAMATHLRTELVLNALNMALDQRRPKAVIHHSDQGAQYTSIAFGWRCREAGVRPSMGSVGDVMARRCARAASPPGSASCSIGTGSAPRPRPGWRSLSSSKAGTTRIVVTLPSTISHL